MFDDNEDVSQEHPTQRLDNSAYAGAAPAGGDTHRLEGGNFPTNAAIAPQPICGECGGVMVWAKTRGYGGPVQVMPNTGIDWLGKHSSYLTALVCANCGFTKLYTAEPSKLLE